MPIFPAYTKDELTARARNLLRSRRRGIDVSYGSDYDLWARVLGALTWAEQKRAEGLLRLLDVPGAFGAYLDAYVRERGLGRDLPDTTPDATRARGRVIFLSAPNAGAVTVPAGTELRHADGTRYTLDQSVTTVVGAKVLRAGHRSGRTRLYQGHLGSGFVAAVRGEVYRAEATGQLVALKDVDNQDALARHLFELEHALDTDPQLHDRFTQTPGAVGRVTAVDAGQRGNKDAGDWLTVDSPPAGLLPDALILGLEHGDDAMSVAALQDALRRHDRERAPVGTLREIAEVARACPLVSVRDCYVTPALEGIGTYGLLPVGDDGGYVSESDRDALVAYLAARFSPVDRFVAQSVYEVVDTGVDFVNVEVTDVYKPDWQLPDESQRGISVTAATVEALTLSPVPSSLRAGDRLILTTRGPSGPYLVVRRIETLAGAVATLDAPLPFPPDLGNDGAGVPYALVTPGGALAEALIDALYDAYAARAPSLGPTGPDLRYPPAQSPAEAGGIVRALAAVEGVLDVALETGTAPTFDQPGGLRVPGCVLRMY